MEVKAIKAPVRQTHTPGRRYEILEAIKNLKAGMAIEVGNPSHASTYACCARVFLGRRFRGTSFEGKFYVTVDD